MSKPSARVVSAAIAVVVVVAAVVGLLIVNSSSSSKAAGGSSTTTVAHASKTTKGPTGSTGLAPTTSTSSPDASATPTTQPKGMPLKVQVSSTSNLHDGQVVSIHVTADPGSDIYGIEARLCASSAKITAETDYYPYQTGNCILQPLSADSDAHTQVAIAAPYQTADLTFRVGVGTDKFTTQQLKQVSITCGPGHPCQLVLLLQYPYGFGFKSYPVTYA